ncbi:hypothetical protein UlMin_041171 [Ulmus minor]
MVTEFKDSAIKLFGKTIALPIDQEILDIDHEASGAASSGVDSDSAIDERFCSRKPLSSSGTTSPADNSGQELDRVKEISGKELTSDRDDSSDQIVNENPNSPSFERETSSSKSEMNMTQEKTLKKPDKIIPCPRCNSMDTKFCYYNNYNVNQPRHFCKNCQRYWTAGGTMRNVPVGAGRRKNKNTSASHYRHIVMSDALRAARASVVNGAHNPTLGSNGTLLTFGSDSPICESMASVLSIVEKTQNCARNGFHMPEQRAMPSSAGGDGDNQSSVSSITASNSSDREGKPEDKNFQGFPPQVPSFPGTPWPFPWNSPHWTSTIPAPTFCHSGFPVSFYPVPTYWGNTVPGSWNLPRSSPPSLSTNPSSTSSVTNSQTLGKHSREGNIISPSSSLRQDPNKENSSSERCVLIPKTLRIEDPSEAAMSSIWTTLGIKNDSINSVNGSGLFKAFQSKGDDKNYVVETSPVLQANPAALSRSLNFLEST